MIKNILILIVFILLTSCNSNWYGDINLGSGFVYVTDPSFNMIYLATNLEDIYASGSTVIEKVEFIGYNQDFIMVITKENDKNIYWIIDKKGEQQELGYEDNRILLLSNVNSSIDLTEFKKRIEKTKIKLKSKNYYR